MASKKSATLFFKAPSNHTLGREVIYYPKPFICQSQVVKVTIHTRHGETEKKIKKALCLCGRIKRSEAISINLIVLSDGCGKLFGLRGPKRAFAGHRYNKRPRNTAGGVRAFLC